MSLTLYSAERQDRDLIVRGRDHVLDQFWTRSGAKVTPSSVFVTVRDATGADVVARTAATVASDVASYTIPAAVTTDVGLGEGWLVIWEAVLPGSAVPREFVGEAALVRYRIAPPAGLDDLYGQVARLDPTHTSPLTRDLDLQRKLDDAWREIERRLYVAGRRSELVMSPEQFRIPHVLLAVAEVFEDLSISSESYIEPAERFRARFNATWSDLVFTYDPDELGRPAGGSTPTRESSSSTVWLTSRGHS